MSQLANMAEQLRRVRRAEKEFLLRAAIDSLIIEPMFLDGLLQAVSEPPAPNMPNDSQSGLVSRQPTDDED